jgi:hypothetical protein
MKKILLISMVIMLIFRQGECAESKIMQKIQQFLPTPTEIGFLTGIVNCYVQISQFVRTTNQLVENVQNAKQQWDRLTDQLTYMYETVQALKNVDPYDMDSWQKCVQRSDLLITADLQDAARLFTSVESYLADSTIVALENLETPQMYEQFCKRNELNIDKVYLTDEYKEALSIYSERVEDIRASLLMVDADMTSLLANRTYEELSPQEKETYLSYRILKTTLEEKMNDPSIVGGVVKSKIDTIIDESRSLMTVNLTEIALAESRIEKMDEVASELISAYDNIIQGNVSTHRNDNVKNTEDVVTFDSAYGTHPNQVDVPTAPENVEADLTNKKTTNMQDAIALQNQIKYTLYKQECLYRDILVMKVNVMAFVVAIETLEHYKKELQSFSASALAARKSDEIKEVRKK